MSGRISGTRKRPGSSQPGHPATHARSTGGVAAPGPVVRSSHNLGADYSSYRKQLEDAGAQRRNRYEMRNAAGIALFWCAAALHYPLLPFTSVTPPPVPPLPSDSEFAAAARSRLKDRSELKLFMRGKKRAISNEIEQLRQEVDADRQRLQRTVALAGKRFLQLNPQVTKAVYDAALAQSPHHATWVGIHDGTAVVVIAFGDRTSMIWPEEVSINASGNVTAKKSLKARMIESHQLLLCRALLGTAKQVLRSHQTLQRVRVIAVDQQGPPLVINRQVWGQATVSRNDLVAFPNTPRLVAELQGFEARWIQMNGVVEDDEEFTFFSPLLELVAKLETQDSSLLGRAGHLVHMRGNKTTGELTTLGMLSSFLASETAVLNLVRNVRLTSAAPSMDVTDVNFWEKLGH